MTDVDARTDEIACRRAAGSGPGLAAEPSLRVISIGRLREHWQRPGRADSEQPLKTWHDVARKARWASHDGVKRDYGARVDLAHGRHVFDIAGNKYRVVCSIDFVRHGVLVLWVGTHAEYDELNRQDGRKLQRL